MELHIEGPPTAESLPFVEALWQAHREHPESLPGEWRAFFDRWAFRDVGADGDNLPSPPGFFAARSSEGDPGQLDGNGSRQEPPAAHESNGSPAALAEEPPRVVSRTPDKPKRLTARIDRLVEAYRTWGHLAANLDPLGRPRPPAPQLELDNLGLAAVDLQTAVSPSFWRHQGPLPLADLVAQLRAVYCGHVGYQYMHLADPAAREWLRRRIEQQKRPLHRRTQLRILNRLTAATGFEHFTRKRYVGAKTFSLAGSESLVPLVDTLIERSADRGMFEIVVGMAHRGRINLLVNVLGQREQQIFRELEDQGSEQRPTSGDVRYHLGYSTDWLSQHGDRIHVSLSFNPSHLEYVNPVALGRTRAKQQRSGDRSRCRGMAVLLHGDASFIGEGIVQESLNLADLPGYTTGGTVHVIIDNQLGFTTDPREGRSTTYSSDVALGFGLPVFHVNGDDPEAVVRIARLTIEYRQKFSRDVVINLHCFRRWGHNEADEPSFTQPLMYRLIESHPTVRDIYLRQLLAAGRITAGKAERLDKEFSARLQSELEAAGRTRSAPRTPSLGGVWSGFVGGHEPSADGAATAVPAEKLKDLLAKLIEVPKEFHIHPKVTHGLARRGEMLRGERPLDWAACEALALASLAVEGRPIRLTGQDTARGTFSQRHAVWHDVETGNIYMPLANLTPTQAPVEVINSPLCEAATLGFEYGFSLDYPEALVAWEAQFGDFWNAAQVIVDQFLASAEDKWSRLSGLVMLLPHGFEGQGPEHSSARLERFLVSAAKDNIQIVVPSTPAQYFHCLRRQVLRRWRKPLIVLTPKSLLRHHDVVSSWDDLSGGGFQPVLEDPLFGPLAASSSESKNISRLILCMGKFYYDLAKAREERSRSDIALVRIEQFYPLPAELLARIVEGFPCSTPVVWCQEEPANMGAWHYLEAAWPTVFPDRPPLQGITRPESASPATGSHGAHRLEQQRLIDAALGD
jgi:2-oxoglutarate dehydrogenase E1 component